ncbi:MAG: hypothetical protein A2505_00790 [Deltaproteobacteria bacterium RIFOXYD12_FULL_55_16]|nr:MAG: hypothetical protein A2505_00790 [Deltaproteobacteria bacterium RIFOXYD12_FULL_55_16]
MDFLMIRVGFLFDWVELHLESRQGLKFFATTLVSFFIITIVVIELNRRQLVPEPFASLFSLSHLAAIEHAFNLLLALEVVSLILSLSHSVTRSVGKQFEILSLIFLRDTFKEFSHFSEPLIWLEIAPSLGNIVASALGALLIFVVLGFFYRAQRSRPISADEEIRSHFILAKKMIALLLLVSFTGICLVDLWGYFTRGLPENAFASFYTLLIFSDVLVVLISLRYSAQYQVSFRNSGYAVATVLIRLALLAPVVIGAVIGVGTALFALGISLAYNAFAPTLEEAKL